MSLSAFLQQKLLFRPTRLRPDYRFRFDQPFDEQWLDTPDGARLNALFFPAPQQPARGVVLYFHGNRGNLQRWGQFAGDFTALGWDFFAPDYRGYGKSTGEPGEAACYADALLVYRHLREKYPPERIALYGRSLGSGSASFLAARVPAKMVILETPFDNIRGLLASHWPRDPLPFEPAFVFPNDEHLAASKLPLLIFHGTRDRIVPFSSAERLKKCLKPGDAFVTLDGGSHHNLREFALYRQRLADWL